LAYKKCILLDVENPDFHTDLANILLEINRPAEAKRECESAIAMDSTDSEPWLTLGFSLDRMNDKKGAEQAFLKSIGLDTTNAESYFNLAVHYSSELRNVEAERCYLKAIQIAPSFSAAFYNLACLKATTGEIKSGFEYLEKSFSSKFTDIEFAQEDPDLAPLRAQSDQWKALMKKHFPDKFKD